MTLWDELRELHESHPDSAVMVALLRAIRDAAANHADGVEDAHPADRAATRVEAEAEALLSEQTGQKEPTMSEHEILINDDGSVQAVYSDDLAPLFEGDDVRVRRASHVEPAALTAPAGCEVRRLTGWAADMGPVGGPVLLADDGGGFTTRREALDAEVAWLRARMAEGRLKVRGDD